MRFILNPVNFLIMFFALKPSILNSFQMSIKKYIIKTTIPESKLLNRAVATIKHRSKSRKLIVKKFKEKVALSRNFLSDIYNKVTSKRQGNKVLKGKY